MAGTIPMVTNVQRGRQVVPQMALLSPSVIASSYARVIGATKEHAQALQGVIASATKFGVSLAETAYKLEEKAQDERDQQAIALVRSARTSMLAQRTQNWAENPPSSKAEVEKRIQDDRAATNTWSDEYEMLDAVRTARPKTLAALRRETESVATNLGAKLFAQHTTRIISDTKNSAFERMQEAAGNGDLATYFAQRDVAAANGALDAELLANDIKAQSAVTTFWATKEAQNIDRANDDSVDLTSVTHIEDVIELAGLDSDDYRRLFDTDGLAGFSEQENANYERHRKAFSEAVNQAKGLKVIKQRVAESERQYVEELSKGVEANTDALFLDAMNAIVSDGENSFWGTDAGAQLVTLFNGDKEAARTAYKSALESMYSGYSVFAKAKIEKAVQQRRDTQTQALTEIISVMFDKDAEMKLAQVCQALGMKPDEKTKTYPLRPVTIVNREYDPDKPDTWKDIHGKAIDTGKPILNTRQVYMTAQRIADARKSGDVAGLIQTVAWLRSYAVRQNDMIALHNILIAQQNLTPEEEQFLSDFKTAMQPFVENDTFGYVLPAAAQHWVAGTDVGKNMMKTYVQSYSRVCELLKNPVAAKLAAQEGTSLNAQLMRVQDECTENMRKAVATDREIALMNGLAMSMGGTISTYVMPVKNKKK